MDPRRTPRTDILWASPECINHSQAKAKRRETARPDLFGETLPEEAVRSRATMWDVPRSAEHHRYRAVIIESGHAETVPKEGQVVYFDEDQVREWHERYRPAKVATLTEVDCSGDPDELVGIRQAARVLGYARKQSIESYRSRNVGYFPDPDATEPKPVGPSDAVGLR